MFKELKQATPAPGASLEPNVPRTENISHEMRKSGTKKEWVWVFFFHPGGSILVVQGGKFFLRKEE